MSLRPLNSTILVFSLVLFISCSDDSNETPKDGGDSSTTDAIDVGTPDAPVPDTASKKPKITKIIPDNGFSSGGSAGVTRVVMTGENFAAGATAYIDGGSAPGGIIMAVTVSSSASLSFNMPKNPYLSNDDAGQPNYKPRKVSVAILINGEMTNPVDFQYTISMPLSATQKTSITTKSMTSYSDFFSDPVYGQVYSDGLTDKTTGEVKTIKVQIGAGKSGSDPSKDTGWKWFTARFDKDETTGYDAYSGSLKAPLSQKYDMAFRFSIDSGQTYYYGDTDEVDLKYDTTKAATLTASNAPVGYCTTSADCALGQYKKVCKVDSADSKKNRCIECLKTSDCTANKSALGPTCTSQNCVCAKDTECAKNVNGAKCMKGTSRNFCGCSSDKNCPHPKKCTQAYICEQ